MAKVKGEIKKKTTYSPEEFATRLDIPVSRVRRWLREGNLKGIKISRSWLIGHGGRRATLSFFTLHNWIGNSH
jgi:excisionase family DNA binding protein